jgi:hypothetical protein
VGVTHHQANIELHIEEIVLHGAEPADRLRIGDAVEAELARLLATGEISTQGDVERINAGTRRLPTGANATTIGTQVARAVHGGLTR